MHLEVFAGRLPVVLQPGLMFEISAACVLRLTGGRAPVESALEMVGVTSFWKLALAFNASQIACRLSNACKRSGLEPTGRLVIGGPKGLKRIAGGPKRLSLAHIN